MGSDQGGRSAPPEIEILEIVGLDASDEPAADESDPSTDPATPTVASAARLAAATRKETEKEQTTAARLLLRDLLPALDALESCVRRRPDFETLDAGVRLALRSLWDVFRRYGLERIEGYGMPFDPAIHEAAAVTPSSRSPVNTVLETLRVGYVLGDELVRPALVRVSVEKGGASEDVGRSG